MTKKEEKLERVIFEMAHHLYINAQSKDTDNETGKHRAMLADQFLNTLAGWAIAYGEIIPWQFWEYAEHGELPKEED